PPETSKPVPGLDSPEGTEEEGMGILPWLGGLAVLLVVGVGAFVFVRRRRVEEEEGFSEEPVSVTGGLSALSGASTAPGEGVNSIFQNTVGQTIDTGSTAAPPSELSQSLPDSIGTDEVDPVEEADVYMAYGRDAQAEELLLDALPKAPERLAIRVKLLEIYANRKSFKEFETMASELYAQTNGQGPDWEKVIEMGQALDPDNPLYGGKGVGIDTRAFIDDALKALPVEEAPPAEPEPMGKGLTDSDYIRAVTTNPTAADQIIPEHVASDDPLLQMLHEGASLKPTDSDLDFDLDHMSREEASPKPTDSDLDFDLDRMEPEPEPKPEPKSAPKPEPVPESRSFARESGTGFAFGGETVKDQVTTQGFSSAETVVNPDVSDLDTLSEMATTVVNPPDKGFSTSVTAREEIGQDTEANFADTLDTPTIIDTGDISSIEPDDDLDFDVQLTESTVLGNPAGMDLSGIDLSLGAGTPKSMREVEDEEVKSLTSDLGVGDESLRDEVNTKLDLAKAYEEMGDLEGARELLNEVVSEGDADQKEQAEAALRRLNS
ncbi:MAG: hypothetical protein LBB55_00050, partial [Zoogloeaceae bacterium]|nr:hypothetical protein [Zoogloeaceae bacterium]